MFFYWAVLLVCIEYFYTRESTDYRLFVLYFWTGNAECLGTELLETLVKMAPTKEEELKLRYYNSALAKLGSEEHFLKAVLDIPFAFKRVDAMLYRVSFETDRLPKEIF